MASIERTAYPRLKAKFTSGELKEFYTPSLEEVLFVRGTARSDEPQLHLLVQLKTFQRLGYFPALENVPVEVIKYLCLSLGLPRNTIPIVIPKTLYRHQKMVRKYLRVKPFDKIARQLITKTIFEAAQTMDNPPDLINAAI